MKNQSYQKFNRTLSFGSNKNSFPLRVMFELTYRCNFNCAHCYLPVSYRRRSVDELKTKEVFLVLDQLAESGCFYVGFTGGEPFLRPDIFQIILHAKKRGMQVIIHTNASLIDEKKAGKLAKLALNKVDIGLPALEQKSFERISGKSNSFKKVFKAIEFLKREKVPLGFKTCVLKENFSQIKAIQDYAELLGVSHRLEDMLFPALDGGQRIKQNIPEFIKRSNAQWLKAHHLKHKLEANECAGVLTDSLFPCGVGSSQCAITPKGEIKLCLMIDYPKYPIFDSDFKDCWRRLKITAAKINNEPRSVCKECDLVSYCKWCPARGYLHSGSFFSCDSQSRTRAEELKQIAEG